MPPYILPEAGARLGDLMKQKIVWKQFENSLTGMFGIKSVSEIAWEQSDMEYLIIMPRPRTTRPQETRHHTQQQTN